MDKLNLIIYDHDGEYVEALTKLFNKRFYKYFRVIGINKYSELENLISSAKKVDILLVNEQISEKINTLKFIKSIIYLCEKKSNQDIDKNILYKYQSGQSIYNFIKRIYKSVNKNVDFDDTYDEAYLMTLFSPIGGVGKTSIAIGIADKMIAQGKKVIYINMEEMSSMGLFFETKSNKKNISDLFYNINQESEKINEVINKIINREKNGVWYINPPNSVLDLAELSSRDFIKAMTYLKRSIDFDYIIVDLGCSYNAIYSSLLQMSDVSLLIMQQNNVSINKMTLLLKQMENIENAKIVINKYIKERKIQINDDSALIKDLIFHYIELDNQIDNNDINKSIINGQSQFSSSIDQLVGKLLREESTTHG